MESDSNTISVGDFLQKLASLCFEQLQVVLAAMPSQSPELRTEKLRAYVKSTKRKLSQAYAICLWLQEEHVRIYLQSTSAMLEEIDSSTKLLNYAQDCAYFLHKNLYSQRVRPLDVVLAKDILARGTYAHLPMSIYTCGTPIQPTKLNETDIRLELCRSIKCKLILDEEMPFELDSLVIFDGYVTLKRNFLFTLVLTLYTAHENSNWCILKCNIEVKGNANDLYEYELDNKDAEMKLTEILKSHFISTPDRLTSEHITSPKSQLKKMIGVCSHIAYASSLRLLYVQALEVSRTYLHGFIEISFIECSDCTEFIVRFWKGGIVHRYASFLFYLHFLLNIHLSFMQYVSNANDRYSRSASRIETTIHAVPQRAQGAV